MSWRRTNSFFLRQNSKKATRIGPPAQKIARLASLALKIAKMASLASLAARLCLGILSFAAVQAPALLSFSRGLPWLTSSAAALLVTTVGLANS